MRSRSARVLCAMDRKQRVSGESVGTNGPKYGWLCCRAARGGKPILCIDPASFWKTLGPHPECSLALLQDRHQAIAWEIWGITGEVCVRCVNSMSWSEQTILSLSLLLYHHSFCCCYLLLLSAMQVRRITPENSCNRYATVQDHLISGPREGTPENTLALFQRLCCMLCLQMLLQ